MFSPLIFGWGIRIRRIVTIRALLDKLNALVRKFPAWNS
jgi:hypothetical protein